MWMELQGKKATHDFLSLYNKDSSFQLHDPRPPPPHPPPSSQGLYLKTHDFLQPFEKSHARESPIDSAAAGPTERPPDHVLPGGVGTYTIGHVSGLASIRSSIKHEQVTCVPSARAAESSGHYAGVPFSLWEEPGANKDPTGSRGQWPPAIVARRIGAFGSISSSRQQGVQERKRPMETVSRSSDDDEEFGKRDGSSSHKGELSGKVERRSSDPSTPRSKHSATEQRRRSKINDRFQILRELIPHSDQKRDKASFLLEVIEYIRFLQEKAQKCEASYPGWNQESAWNNNQGPADGPNDPSQVIKGGSVPAAFMFSGRFHDNSITVAPVMSNSQNPSESDNLMADISYKTIENSPVAAVHVPLQPNLYATVGNETAAAQNQQRMLSDGDNFVDQSQSQNDCAVNSDMLNEQEELTVDEGTISVSSVYSQGLLTSLTEALQSSGVDLSQASISVRINFGKRVTDRRPGMGNAKEHGDGHRALGHSRMGSTGGEEAERMPKRRRSENR
ncbi:transcription factor BIM2-like isoform X2 [Dioscorea cayenensis subsp. rotundata]|uniref:Transcription factor BIM2-like isoform X2 n=1 Tax=Dioscorea cayennensis subsp. rotundata TaxID=55577 RepID=A0AB40AN28_DIOCR|nr:transcription factor BIM2-like isoform X2 [Dioscorea cayenensis subsp. rotundata]